MLNFNLLFNIRLKSLGLSIYQANYKFIYNNIRPIVSLMLLFSIIFIYDNLKLFIEGYYSIGFLCPLIILSTIYLYRPDLIVNTLVRRINIVLLLSLFIGIPFLLLKYTGLDCTIFYESLIMIRLFILAFFIAYLSYFLLRMPWNMENLLKLFILLSIIIMSITFISFFTAALLIDDFIILKMDAQGGGGGNNLPQGSHQGLPGGPGRGLPQDPAKGLPSGRHQESFQDYRSRVRSVIAKVEGKAYSNNLIVKNTNIAHITPGDPNNLNPEELKLIISAINYYKHDSEYACFKGHLDLGDNYTDTGDRARRGDIIIKASQNPHRYTAIIPRYPRNMRLVVKALHHHSNRKLLFSSHSYFSF